MKIAVIGAGIAGVATAHELAALGHEVTVFEHKASVAAEGSFALPGWLAASSPLPWAAPGMRRRRGRAWLSRQGDLHAPLPSVLQLAGKLWRQARLHRVGSTAFAQRQAALQALARLSWDRLGQLTQAHGLNYERRDGGLLLLSTTQQLAAAQAALDKPGPELAAAGWELLSAEQARALEPDLAQSWPLRAALRMPRMAVGNARLLAQALKALAQQQGTVFRFGALVRALRAAGPGGAAALQLAGTQDWQTYEQIVLCAGAGSEPLLRAAGLKLRLLSPWSHALTAPLRHVEGLGMRGPAAGVIDAASGIAIARLGQRLRVTGLQQLGGSPTQIDLAISRRLFAALEHSYPGCAVLREAALWKGQRHRSTDGLPMIGSALPGLWLNTGHGAHGWALACGAAQALAMALTEQAAPIALDAFAPTRRR